MCFHAKLWGHFIVGTICVNKRLTRQHGRLYVSQAPSFNYDFTFLALVINLSMTHRISIYDSGLQHCPAINHRDCCRWWSRKYLRSIYIHWILFLFIIYLFFCPYPTFHHRWNPCHTAALCGSFLLPLVLACNVKILVHLCCFYNPMAGFRTQGEWGSRKNNRQVVIGVVCLSSIHYDGTAWDNPNRTKY